VGIAVATTVASIAAMNIARSSAATVSARFFVTTCTARCCKASNEGRAMGRTPMCARRREVNDMVTFLGARRSDTSRRC
jgi:hypothetical protein